MAVGEARSSNPRRGGRAETVRFDPSRSILVPAHADVAVLELEGRFHASAHRSVGKPRLVVSAGGESIEVKAVDAESTHAGPDPEPWSASFAIPRALADAEDAAFALAIGRSLVLDLPRPVAGPPPPPPSEPSLANPKDEVEGKTWGSMVVDLSEARRELAEVQNDLARAREENQRLQAEAEAALAERAAAESKERPPVTWLEEVEAEAATATNGAGPHDPADVADRGEHPDDDDDGVPALPALADRRIAPPATFEHDAVYDATLKRMQVERRARLRRRRILGRLLALLVFLAAAAAIYIVATGQIGVDILELF